MTAPVPTTPAERLEELWKRIGGVLEGDSPIHSRIAEAAVLATGARDATLYVRDRDAWVRTGERLAGGVEPGEIPEPLPAGVFTREGHLWLPLSAEGELHGLLRLADAPRRGVPRAHGAPRVPLRLPRRRPPAGAPGAGRGVRAQGAAAGARVPLRPRALARRPARPVGARRRSPVPIDLADGRRQGRARPLRRRRPHPPRAQRRGRDSRLAGAASPGRCPRAA